MQALTAQITHDYSDKLAMLHVGDIPHRLYNGMRSRPPETFIGLWHDDDGTLVAWAMAYGRFKGVDFLVHPTYHNSPLEDAVVSWGVDTVYRELPFAEKNPSDWHGRVP